MTLGIFKGCDNKYGWDAYIRIGLSFVMGDGRRTNFCDTHLGWIPMEPIDKGIFSGPKDKANQITRYERSDEAINRYESTQTIQSDLDITAGGVAQIIRDKKRNTTDFWLFGPLLLNGVAYGSLVAELEGFVKPKGHHKFTLSMRRRARRRSWGNPMRTDTGLSFRKTTG
jgi:hypothetical protein